MSPSRKPQLTPSFQELREWEKQRLEAVGNKLRTQREELEQRRKDSQVKFTEKLLPMKRPQRGCKSDFASYTSTSSHSYSGGQSQPKTLFQKTRSDAVKMQKGIYGARIPVPPVKTLHLPMPPFAKMTRPSSSLSTSGSSSSSSTGTRVTVTAIPRNPVATVKSSVSVHSIAKPRPMVCNARPLSKLVPVLPTTSSFDPHLPRVPSSLSGSTHTVKDPFNERSVPLKPPPPRKDPKAAIFMPKHRSYSQLPTQSPGMRARV